MEPTRLALHEAAHGVVAMHLGAQLESVSTRREAKTLGRLRLANDVPASDRLNADEMACVCLSGACAELIEMGKLHDDTRYYGDDFALVGQYASQAGLTGEPATSQWFLDAGNRALATLKMYWPAVKRIAQRLEAGEELDHDDVHAEMDDEDDD